MKLEIQIKEIEAILSRRLSKLHYNQLLNFYQFPLPHIVYTSFDGDFLSHSELMKQSVLKKKRVPLNPESALGTYVVTNHYDGDKGPIIEDCLSLINISDVFYVMTPRIPLVLSDLQALPEGVLAEIIYWIKTRNKPVTFVDISSFQEVNKKINLNEALSILDSRQKEGLEKSVNTESLRPTAYLLMGEAHAKHADWTRKDAYNKGRVPLSPYTLINHSTLQIAFKNDFLQKLMCRVSLAVHAHEIYLYSIHTDDMFSLDNLPTDVLTELYAVLQLKPKATVHHYFFGRIGVPKYVNRKKWAITDYEREAIETHNT